MDTHARKNLIALFGGTFNPIHNGHIGALRQLQQHANFTQTFIIPNAIPPHRNDNQVAAKHRLAMCRLAVEGMCDTFVSDIEIAQADKPSFSVDTLRHFHQNKNADEALVFVIGEDSYNSFTQWHQWKQILGFCSLLVLQRKTQVEPKESCDNRKKLEKYHAPIANLGNEHEYGAIFFANNDYFPYSSTQIRTWLHNRIQCSAKNISDDVGDIADQKVAKNLNLALDAKVLDYIKEQNLYR